MNLARKQDCVVPYLMNKGSSDDYEYYRTTLTTNSTYSNYLVPGIRSSKAVKQLVRSSTRYLISGIWYQVPGTIYSGKQCIWYLVAVPESFESMFRASEIRNSTILHFPSWGNASQTRILLGSTGLALQYISALTIIRWTFIILYSIMVYRYSDTRYGTRF